MVRTLQKEISGLVLITNPKRLLSIIVLTCLAIVANAQTGERRWNIGLMGGFSVYKGDLGDNMTKFNSEAAKQNMVGAITFSRYINRSFDFSLMGAYGNWGYYAKTTPVFRGVIMHANASFKYKLNNGYMLSEKSRLGPYLFAGMGFSDFSGSHINLGRDYPIIGGLGLNFRINSVLSINYQATYGYMRNAHNDPLAVPAFSPTGHDMFMLHTLGLGFNLGSGRDEDKDGVSDKKDKCSGTPAKVKVDGSGCPYDADGDGMADYLDKCPNLAGPGTTGGCPDSDKDGVADADDQCPDEVGLAQLKGCPDTDGDGIIDSKDKCPNVKGALTLDGCPDRDNDGIRDEDDMCPDVKGVVLFKGCPDTDNDGVEDSRDMCPTVKGSEATSGCPDTDNDGVHDGIDKCPQVAGEAAHSGCPDTDNDGVFDDMDQCLAVPGSAENHGCPELKKDVKQLFTEAQQGIQFETGKAVIKPVSFPILKSIAKVMKENPAYILSIGAHTDDVGDDAVNMTLSQDRASAVADYLVAQQIDPLRITATGYGETMPVDSNKTLKGRTKNRRVEFNIKSTEETK